MTATLSVDAVHEIVALVWVIEEAARPVGTLGGVVSGVVFHVAVTQIAEVSDTTQVVALPEQPPPDQLMKVEPEAGTSVSVTHVPELRRLEVHVAPQEMPPTELVTVPDPVPAFTTVRAKVGEAFETVTQTEVELAVFPAASFATATMV